MRTSKDRFPPFPVICAVCSIGHSEPIVTDAAKYIYDCSWENILTNPPVGQINLEQWVLI